MATNCSAVGLDPGSLEVLISQNKNNLTALQTIRAPGFVSSPEVRGTTDIVFSCVVTLIACIYTALHLNVPMQSGLLYNLILKGKWVFIGLLAPELVLYLAISQFLQARSLVKELNALLEKKSNDLEAGRENATGGEPADDNDPITAATPSKERDVKDSARRISATREESDIKSNDAPRPFDLKYGFFVAMGGIEVPVHDIEPRKEGAARGTQFSGRVRITAKGVLQLAKAGYFVPIPGSRIDDKSKADFLQKTLIMLQVLWMVTQCLARKIYGLPLTLLEIHTMVHVVCAVVLLALWIDVSDCYFY